MEAKVLLLDFILFITIAVTTVAQQKNTDNFLDKKINQDSICRARESKLRLDSYRQSPEDAAKIKALIERSEQKNCKDSVVVINDIPCIIRNVAKPTDKLYFLKESEGKYPDNIDLFKKEVFRKRLKNLLSNRFRFLIKNFNVQIPIEITDDIFMAFGCQAHNCAETNFMIAYDFPNDVLHVGIREEGRGKIYSENRDIPAKMIEWAD